MFKPTLFLFCALLLFSQTFENDTLIVVSKNSSQGFENEYILFIPKGLNASKIQHILVEVNNTGKAVDDIEVHKVSAISLAKKSSIGNNISTELKLPFLVPIFPRSAKNWKIYTHALDRDAIHTNIKGIKRLDLQLIAMFQDAKKQLKRLNVETENKMLLNGFSASGSFTNRFTMLHPEYVKAAASGGLNGIIILPLKKRNSAILNYPLGINNISEITGKPFQKEVYSSVPQMIYMGTLDDNDAVIYDDAYDDDEREAVYKGIAKKMQPDRWQLCQEIYKEHGFNVIFKTYENIGHGTTGAINLEIILFFLKHIKN